MPLGPVTPDPQGPPETAAASPRTWPVVELLTGLLLAGLLARTQLAGLLDQPAVQTWLTIFVAIVLQTGTFGRAFALRFAPLTLLGGRRLRAPRRLVAAVSALVQGWLLLVTAMLLLRVSLTDTYLLYVKAGMRPWLLASAVVLLLLGLPRYWQGLRARTASPPDQAGSHHHTGPSPRAAWLLVLPVFAIFLAAPAPLGTHAATRQPAAQPTPPAPEDSFGPLPRGADGVADLTVLAFVWRADSESPSAASPDRHRPPTPGSRSSASGSPTGSSRTSPTASHPSSPPGRSGKPPAPPTPTRADRPPAPSRADAGSWGLSRVKPAGLTPAKGRRATRPSP